MINTFLFDLDGTLLPHSIGFFLQKYTLTLAMRFSSIVPMERFGQMLMASSRAMMHNSDPNRTNRDAFLADFVSRIGLPEARVMPIFDRFYAEDFPKLKRYTRTNPLAREIVRTASERGFGLVIATNPLFPETAIRERMRWAAIDDFPYRLVTHFENMHTSKPNPDYYQEILDQIGAGPESCLMVGNDTEIDLAASEVGIATYLVTDCLEGDPSGRYRPDHHGTLAEFFGFLRELPSPPNTNV